MDNLHGLDYRPTAFRLEWMQEAERIYPTPPFSRALVQELRPDVLHVNQFCYGIAGGCAGVVMAHGDLSPGRSRCKAARRVLRAGFSGIAIHCSRHCRSRRFGAPSACDVHAAGMLCTPAADASSITDAIPYSSILMSARRFLLL